MRDRNRRLLPARIVAAAVAAPYGLGIPAPWAGLLSQLPRLLQIEEQKPQRVRDLIDWPRPGGIAR